MLDLNYQTGRKCIVDTATLGRLWRWRLSAVLFELALPWCVEHTRPCIKWVFFSCTKKRYMYNVRVSVFNFAVANVHKLGMCTVYVFLFLFLWLCTCQKIRTCTIHVPFFRFLFLHSRCFINRPTCEVYTSNLEHFTRNFWVPTNLCEKAKQTMTRL